MAVWISKAISSIKQPTDCKNFKLNSISTENHQLKLTFEGKKNRSIKRITFVMSFGLIGAACFDRLRSYYGDTLTLMVEFDKDVTDCELFYNDTEFVTTATK
jgi:hypothetical protein